MLSIAPISGARSAYYVTGSQDKSGYYLNGHSATYWGGGAKDALGLPDGPIKAVDFDHLIDGHLPNGKRVGNPTKDGNWNRNPGRDLTFSDPKSVSILAQGPLREQILDIRRAAIGKTMDYLENHFAETRISGEYVGDQKTIYAVVNEETSRANDPGLHAHVVLFNMVQGRDGEFRAMHNPKLYDNAILLGQIYRSELAKGIKDLGFEIEPVGNHGQWEISSIPKEIRQAFSKRRQEIVAKIDPANDNAKQRERISVITRPAKKLIERSELLSHWAAELAKFKTSFKALSQPPARERPQDHWSSKHAVKTTMKIVSETKSSIGKYQFMREVMDRTHGHLTIDIIESEISTQIKSGNIVQSECGQYYKSSATLGREKTVVEELIKGHLKSEPLVSNTALKNALKDSHLTKGQQAGVRLITRSNARTVKIQGDAGTGKTTALKTAVGLIKNSGYKTVGIAPTNKATDELNDTGAFDKTMTLQKYLLVPQGDQKTVLIVDESSLIGTKQMQDLLRFTNAKGMPRVVFVGDENQMQGVQAGQPFKDMEKAGVRSVVLDEIIRQKDERHRSGVKQLAKADLKSAFKTLKPEIHEISIDKMNAHAISAWKDTQNVKTPIIVQRNRQKTDINNAIIADRRDNTSNLKSTTLETWQPVHKSNEGKRFVSSYLDATHVRFNRDYKRLNIKRGEIYKLVGINKDKAQMTLSKNGRMKTFAPAKYKMGDGAIEIYRQEDRTLHEGDRIRFTRGGTKRPVSNNDYGTVEKIGNGKITFAMDRDKSITLKLNDPAIRHIDHAWASTTHAFQGKTVDHAVVVMPSRKSPLTTLNSLYTSASRHRLGLTIVTDDADRLQANIERSLDVEKLEANIKWPEIDARKAEIKDQMAKDLIRDKELVKEKEREQPVRDIQRQTTRSMDQGR